MSQIEKRNPRGPEGRRTKSKHSEKTKIKTSPHRTSISKSRSTTPSTTSNETSRSKTTNTFSSENKSTSSGIDAATAAAIKRSIFEVEPVDLFSSMYDRIKRKAAIPKSVTAPTTSRSRKDRSGSSPDDRSSSHKSSDRRSSKKKDRSKSDSKGRRRRKRRESSDDEDVRRFDSSSAEESGHSDAEKKKKKSLKQARSGTKESDSMKKSGFIIAKQRRRRSKKKEVRMQSSSGDEFDVVKSSSDEDDKRSSTSKYLKASKQDEKRKRKVKHSKTSPTHSVRNSLEKCNRGLESFIKDSRRSSSKPVDDNFEIPDDTPFSLDWNSELPTKSSSASGVRRNKTPSRSNSRQRSSHRNMSDDDDDMRSISRATSSEMSVPLSLAKKEKRASKDRTSSPCTDNQRDEDMKATDMLEELMSDHREVRGKQQDGVAGVSNIGKSSMPGRAVSSSSRQNVVLASGTVARKSYPSPPELIPEISRGLKSQTLTTNASSKAAVPTTKEKPIVAKKPTAPEPPKLQAQIARDVTKDSERKRKEIVGSESCEPAAKSIALSSSAKQSATKATGSFRSASGQEASAPLASFIPAPVITVNDDVPLMTPISGASSANVKLETEAWKNVVSGGLISNEQKPLNFIRGTAPVLVKHDIKPEVPCATTSRPIGLIQAPKIANVTSITDKNPISHTRPIAHAVVAGTNVRPAPIQPLRVPVNLTSLANLNLSTCHTAYIAATQANAANVASNAMGIAYSPYASTIVVPSSGTKLATSTANVSKSGGLVSGSVPLTIDTALPSMKMNAPLGTAADYRATGFMPGNSPLVGGQIKTTGVWDPSTQSPRGQSISATGLSPGGWPAHSQQQLPSNWNLHNAAPAQASNHASPLLNNESLLNTQASPPAFLQQFPTAWTGYLSIKNDQALVRMFFVSGNGQLTKVLGPASTLKHNSLPLLKMVQRMRLDPTQLQMVEKRAQMANGHCMLIACATGRCEAESSKQGAALESGFITYLQQKQACGIVSVNGGAPHPFQSTIHIFPPCEWSHRTLNRVAPQLATFMATTPHLFLLITSEV